MAELQCAKLLNDENYKIAMEKYNLAKDAGTDVFGMMLYMQKTLQEALYKKNPDLQDINNLESLGQIADWLRDNKLALDDEYREVIDALAGMNKPQKERSALWKKWKKNYHALRNEKLKDLSPDELTELKFEVCDMFHFFMNLMLGVGMTAEEMFVYYMYKNQENFDRIQRGY